MSDPTVCVPFVSGMLLPHVAIAVNAQSDDVLYARLPTADETAYADALRALWSEPGLTVIVEQDTVPPDGSIQRLIDCPWDWCTHPHRVGGRLQIDTLGLVKFSARLKRRHPDLAHLALAREDHEWFTRQGWTGVSKDANPATMRRYGRRACLRPDAPIPDSWRDPAQRPSTVAWWQCDRYLAAQLRSLKYTPHVHLPETNHLHLYQ